MASSDYLEGVVIDHLLRTNTWSKPSAVYVALFVGDTEVTGAGYGRVQHGPSDATWSAPVAGNGISRNQGIIQFGAPTADWGTIDNVRLFSASSGGNEFAKGDLDVPLTVNNGDAAPAFPTDSLTFTIS